MSKLAWLAISLVVSSTLAQAQPARYPNRTIENVVAYGAGGSTDLVARTIAQRFQERLGQSVGVLNQAGGGVASPPHVMGAWFSRLNKLDVVHVPYRGGAQAVADVIGGHVDLFFAGLAAAKAAIDSGSVKAFAVTGNVRSSALPNVPTFKEAGVADFELASWNVLLAPKGTPSDILQFLRQETAVALNDPKVREIFAAQGVESSSTQDVRAFLAQERAGFGRVVRDLGITIDQ